ncbi:hypothetical protein D3C86_1727790 [compost metagenome]
MRKHATECVRSFCKVIFLTVQTRQRVGCVTEVATAASSKSVIIGSVCSAQCFRAACDVEYRDDRVHADREHDRVTFVVIGNPLSLVVRESKVLSHGYRAFFEFGIGTDRVPFVFRISQNTILLKVIGRQRIFSYFRTTRSADLII